jgi:hypothetical protein
MLKDAVTPRKESPIKSKRLPVAIEHLSQLQAVSSGNLNPETLTAQEI